MKCLAIDTVTNLHEIHLAWYEESICQKKSVIPFAREHRFESLWETLPTFFSEIPKSFRPDAVVVVKGPGGFTAARGGVVIANALAYGFSCPVVGMTKDEARTFLRDGQIDQYVSKKGNESQVEPLYEKAPNISRNSGRWRMREE